MTPSPLPLPLPLSLSSPPSPSLSPHFAPSPTPSLQPNSLLLIRHGERADKVPSDPWYNDRHPRPRDPPLTAHGHDLATDAAAHLCAENVHCACVYSSPLTRCLETAAAIARTLRVPVKVLFSLAKSCKYFRTCKLQNIEPQIPDRQEMVTILQKVHPDVHLAAYIPDDGLSCTQAIQNLVRNTACLAAAAPRDSRLSTYVTVIAGHCESQSELTRLSGFTLKRRPYCGRATFQLTTFETEGTNVPLPTQHTMAPVLLTETNSHWQLFETPMEYFHRIEPPS